MRGPAGVGRHAARARSWPGGRAPGVDGQAIAEVAADHLDALDAQIRALRLHRSVLAIVVKRAAGNEEMPMMGKLARMSVAEHRQMIDDFMAEVIEDWNPSNKLRPALEQRRKPAR